MSFLFSFNLATICYSIIIYFICISDFQSSFIKTLMKMCRLVHEIVYAISDASFFLFFFKKTMHYIAIRDFDNYFFVYGKKTFAKLNRKIWKISDHYFSIIHNIIHETKCHLTSHLYKRNLNRLSFFKEGIFAI